MSTAALFKLRHYRRRQTTEAMEFIWSLGVDCPYPDALAYGGLIGTVVIREIIYADRRGRPMLLNGERVMRSGWFNGDAGFVLEDAEPVPADHILGPSPISGRGTESEKVGGSRREHRQVGVHHGQEDRRRIG
jgi:hypothetical protein